MTKMRVITVGTNVWREIEDTEARRKAIDLIQAGVWYITLADDEATPKPRPKPKTKR